mmetsp:Transcript_43426/g.79496  ORF Transcript_43426/g.79496 Transcript_43426/m.79496 type:complete len:138 (-) Transcript_43426:373-786(-)
MRETTETGESEAGMTEEAGMSKTEVIEEQIAEETLTMILDGCPETVEETLMMILDEGQVTVEETLMMSLDEGQVTVEGTLMMTLDEGQATAEEETHMMILDATERFDAIGAAVDLGIRWQEAKTDEQQAVECKVKAQ